MPPGVVLFHLRGRKRVFVYPGDEAHLPEHCMEQVVARQTTEELPYDRAFEADARVLDLTPGQALTWPVYAPHRVENLDAFCVSLSMEYQTWPSRLRTGALYTNAVLRSRGWRAAQHRGHGSAGTGGPVGGFPLALRRAGALKSRLGDFQRDFEPVVGAPDGARPLHA